MRKFILAVLFLAAVAGPVSAGFKDNYAEWRGMNTSDKANFIMGLYDATVHGALRGEQEAATARRLGIDQCAVELKLDALMIGEAVSRHYETHARDWGLPVAPVFFVVLQNICLSHINVQRAKLRLPDWVPINGSIMDRAGK